MSALDAQHLLPPEVARTLDALLARHPAFAAHERFVHDRLAELATRAYAHGESGALLGLRTAADAALDLGIDVSGVRRHARRLDLGWHTGRDLILRPADVEAIRARVGQVGRPRHAGDLP